MSEEKLYAVKDDEGLLLLYSEQGAPLWRVWGEMFADKPTAERAAHAENGHVVTLIEEPEKVVLTKEQAEIVENARDAEYPATYISDHSHSDEERLIINAYVNGYTVAKEKKYLLPMDGTLEENDDNDNYQLYAYCHKGRWLADEVETDPSYKHPTVTQKELETAPAWVKTIKPVEVTDDDD
ncbi:DUF1642 domain-containing protein [Lacticaseibacillus zeae]|uniref:DUF1642 domain-containing protein n=1 Tax=Lacticaseibacillus zeae TaxID=57037 RepID=A0A5R8M206_LACZE|nr:DUF1642 domain-containing protein [Lacticaseibacillus zeae]TLF43593.1 DUF1642 domain-containing protein [Lacticaseibacillus zeae]